MAENKENFVIANTQLICSPLVPEIKLHLATDAMALWQMTEAELNASGLAPPFWAFAWAGGQAIARYILDNPVTVAGKNVLDVASGSGISGLAALFSSAANVSMNEVDSFAKAAIVLNGKANKVATRMGVLTRDILEEPILTENGTIFWEVVLAGDVFYENSMAYRMLEFLKRHADSGATVLVGDPGRNYLPISNLKQLARYSVKTPTALENSDQLETSVYQFIS